MFDSYFIARSPARNWYHGGHFVFARPGFADVKERLARWFRDDLAETAHA